MTSLLSLDQVYGPLQLNSLWYIIAYDCFIDSRRPAILCKTITKQCFCSKCSLCCFLANLRWRNTQLCLWCRMSCSQAVWRHLSLLLLATAAAAVDYGTDVLFLCSDMKSSNRQGSSLSSIVSLEPVRPPPFVTSVSMTNLEQQLVAFQSWFFLLVVLFCHVSTWICIQ